MAIPSFTTPDQVTALLVALTALLGVLGKLIYGKYYPGLKETPATPTEAHTPPPEEDTDMIGRMHAMLRDYVAVKLCDAKHEGICGKLEMMNDEIKSNRTLAADQHKEVVTAINDLRNLIVNRGNP